MRMSIGRILALAIGLRTVSNRLVLISPAGAHVRRLNTTRSVLSSKRELKILKFGSGTVSLKKVVSVSQWVTKQDGGELILDYNGSDHDNGDAKVTISLTVSPKAISSDANLILSLDDQYLDIAFNPHGITFSDPALLNIEAQNLDLSGIDPDQINIHYDNPDTGQWEVVPSYDIIVDAEERYLRVVDAQLPHFSRYAIAIDN